MSLNRSTLITAPGSSSLAQSPGNSGPRFSGAAKLARETDTNVMNNAQVARLSDLAVTVIRPPSGPTDGVHL